MRFFRWLFSEALVQNELLLHLYCRGESTRLTGLCLFPFHRRKQALFGYLCHYALVLVTFVQMLSPFSSTRGKRRLKFCAEQCVIRPESACCSAAEPLLWALGTDPGSLLWNGAIRPSVLVAVLLL